jgi:hypothetical protein
MAVQDRNIPKLDRLLKTWSFSREDKFYAESRGTLRGLRGQYARELRALARSAETNHASHISDAVKSFTFAHTDSALGPYREQIHHLKAEEQRKLDMKHGDFRALRRALCTSAQAKGAWTFPSEAVFRVNALLYKPDQFEKEIVDLEQQWAEMLKAAAKAGDDLTSLRAVIGAWVEKFPQFKVDTFVNEHYPEFAELRTLEKTLQEELEK